MITNKAIPGYSSVEPTSFFNSLIRVVFNGLIIAAALYFFFNIILGGIEWMGSAGDKNKLAEARSRVLNAIIGVVVVFGLFIIINFISGVFGIDLTGFQWAQLQL